jgi:hypothetical protein
MTEDRGRERFRVLPEQVRPEDTIETVDTRHLPTEGDEDERARMLRSTGSG